MFKQVLLAEPQRLSKLECQIMVEKIMGKIKAKLMKKLALYMKR